MKQKIAFIIGLLVLGAGFGFLAACIVEKFRCLMCH